MLLRVSFQNILSFYRRSDFDMFPNPKREIFPQHINETGQIPLLKHALIYGANGAGKSNFVKVLQFLKSFVIDCNFLDKIDLKDFFFQLVKSNKESIKIEIEFFTSEKYYIYGMKFNILKRIQSTNTFVCLELEKKMMKQYLREKATTFHHQQIVSFQSNC